MDIRVNDNKRLRDAGGGLVVMVLGNNEELCQGEVLAEVQYLDHADQGWWVMLVDEGNESMAVWAIPHRVGNYHDHVNAAPVGRHHVDDIYLWHRMPLDIGDVRALKGGTFDTYDFINMSYSDATGTRGVQMTMRDDEGRGIAVQVLSNPGNLTVQVQHFASLADQPYRILPSGPNGPLVTETIIDYPTRLPDHAVDQTISIDRESFAATRFVLVSRRDVSAMIDWVLSANVTLAGTPVGSLLGFIQDPHIEILNADYSEMCVHVEASVWGHVAKYETNDWSMLSEDARKMAFSLITQISKEVE